MTRGSYAADASCGFSLVELLIALAVTLLLASAVCAMLAPAGGAFQAQPEAADVEQRLRASVDVLVRDVMAAGSLPSIVLGGQAPDVRAAAIFPMRVGRVSADPPGSFDTRGIAIWSVSSSAPQAWLASPLASASGSARVTIGPGCVEGDVSCGFRAGMMVLALGPAGQWDLFTIVSVQGTTLSLQHNLRDSATVHPAAQTVLAEASVRNYFFKDDPATGFADLRRYDGASGADVPVVQHVADLRFDYFGAADPPMLVQRLDPAEPARATYGPLPPAPDVAQTAYPAGENCAFLRTSDSVVIPRLATLASGAAMVPLPASLLTDGPWCPDATSPNRYDADLLRVRQVVITLKTESALEALRGPAGPLFMRAGTARGSRLVPDRVVRMSVTPRALRAAW
jgi:prepilin-type N-terminal cleavage/methylation domain-containing protein